MKWLKNQFKKSEEKNQRVKDHLKDRLSHIRRKMSRGAANIFRVIKDRTKWGNKQLWGSREKGKNKPGHKTPKS